MYEIFQEELSETVYRRIKEMILKNDLVSGQKLNQESLAAHLGVSRTPLLSAFAKLQKEFLIELVPRRGSFVKKLTRAELENLFDIRIRLEPLGAQGAALHGSPQEMAELAATLSECAKQIAMVEANQAHGGSILEADYRFHMAIMRMSRNEFLYQMISTFNIIIVSNLSGLLKPARQSLQEHQQILMAIRRRDAPEADRLMHAHLTDARRQLVEVQLRQAIDG